MATQYMENTNLPSSDAKATAAKQWKDVIKKIENSNSKGDFYLSFDNGDGGDFILSSDSLSKYGWESDDVLRAVLDLQTDVCCADSECIDSVMYEEWFSLTEEDESFEDHDPNEDPEGFLHHYRETFGKEYGSPASLSCNVGGVELELETEAVTSYSHLADNFYSINWDENAVAEELCNYILSYDVTFHRGNA